MNKNWLKILSLILSGVLLVLLLAYIGGVLAEFVAHQQEWQAAGGFMDSSVRIAKMSFNPIVVLGFAITGAGLRFVVLELMLIGLFIAYQCGYRWRKKKAYDDQNYVVSDRGTYGNARWMEKSEVSNVLALEKPRSAQGVILGEYYDRNLSPIARAMQDAKGACDLVTMPQDTTKSGLNGHILMVGPSGSGKSRWLRNQLFQAIKAGQSVVVTDPKGELFSDTAMMFYRHGYTVRILNLKDPDKSYQWNPFNFIDPDDTLMCTRLAQMIIANTSNGKASDPFFENGEEALLGMLIIYMLNRKGASEEEKSFRYLLSLLNERNMEKLEGELEANPQHPAYSAYQKYKRQPKTQQDSFATGLYVRLHLMEDERLANMITETNPDLAIDLELPAYQKCAYFISIPIHDSSLEFVSSMFFTLLISRLEKYAETHPNEKGEARCPLVVNLYLDEFCNIGKLGQDVSTIEQMLSTIRSYNLRMLIIVQSLGQLDYKYTAPLAKSILANCGIQILLACNDPATAQYFSDRCGQLTTVVESTRVTKQTWAIAQMIPSYGESSGEGKRALMPYDAIMTLRKDPKRKYRMLVAAQGQNVLDLDAFDYTRHWMSKEIDPISIPDFIQMDLQSCKSKREHEAQLQQEQYAARLRREAEADRERREREAALAAMQRVAQEQAAMQAELAEAKAEAERLKAELEAAQQAARVQAEREAIAAQAEAKPDPVIPKAQEPVMAEPAADLKQAAPEDSNSVIPEAQIIIPQSQEPDIPELAAKESNPVLPEPAVTEPDPVPPEHLQSCKSPNPITEPEQTSLDPIFDTPAPEAKSEPKLSGKPTPKRNPQPKQKQKSSKKKSPDIFALINQEDE